MDKRSVIVTARPPKRVRKPAVAPKVPPIVTDHKLRPRVWEEGEEEVQGLLRTVARAKSPQQIKRERRRAMETEFHKEDPKFQRPKLGTH